MKEIKYKFVYTFDNTVKNKVCKNKLEGEDSNADDVGGVYIINCNNCGDKYVGETGRGIRTRIQEHRRAVQLNSQGSAIARHCWEKDHRMDFKNSRLIYKSNNISHRRVVEGALIRQIKVIEGNKGFTSEDPISRSLILKEAKIDPSDLEVRSPAQQTDGDYSHTTRVNTTDHQIRISDRQEEINNSQENGNQDSHHINDSTGRRSSRRLLGLEPA